MTENNPKLKLAVARMLPHLIEHRKNYKGSTERVKEGFYRKDDGFEVLETEWLYIVSLVEQGLSDAEYYGAEFGKSNTTSYLEYLSDIEPIARNYVSATFNQRATALCKVKGIEV